MSNQLKTILHFEVIKDSNIKLLKTFKSVKLEYAGIKLNYSNTNDIIFNTTLDEQRIYYNEIISFFTEENDEIPLFSIEYPIYFNKLNIIYIDHNKNEYFVSVELIFQSVNENLLPTKIVYDGLNLNKFDIFQNKLRKRIGLFNINPKKLDITNNIYEQYPDFQFEKENSYQILIRIPQNGETKYSITNFDLIEKNVNKIIKKFENKKKFMDLLLEFNSDFHTLIQNTVESEIINEGFFAKINEKYNIIENLGKDYYDNVLNYSDFEEIDLNIFHYMFYCQEFFEIYKMNIGKEKKFILTEKLFLDFNSKYEKNILRIKELNFDIKDKILLIKTYNKHYINSFTSGKDINYISILNIKELNENNAYKKAIEFIKLIICHLKEESRLFEVFLYLDSDIIENLLINNTEKSINYEDSYNNKKILKYEKNPTEYGLNMLNIDEIRMHLYKLIPKYIIRIDSEMKINANYEPNTKIMTLNEKRIFKISSLLLNKLIEDEKNNKPLIIPIIIEILHEIYGHGKIRLINNKIKSPEEYRDSKHDFNRCKIQKKIKINDFVNYPESGVILENFISEKRKILKWLKTIHAKNDIKEILDITLWVDKDFNKLEEKIESYLNNEDDKEEHYQTYIDSNDDSFSDSDDSENIKYYSCLI